MGWSLYRVLEACGLPPHVLLQDKAKALFSFENRAFYFLLKLSGGDKRDRTADLLNAIQALSRTSRLHTPFQTQRRGCLLREIRF